MVTSSIATYLPTEIHVIFNQEFPILSTSIEPAEGALLEARWTLEFRSPETCHGDMCACTTLSGSSLVGTHVNVGDRRLSRCRIWIQHCEDLLLSKNQVEPPNCVGVCCFQKLISCEKAIWYYGCCNRGIFKERSPPAKMNDVFQRLNRYAWLQQ